MSNENKLSVESAEKELEKFYEWYEIDTNEFSDTEGDSDDSRANKALQKMQAKILKAVMKGKLSFEENEEGFQIIFNKSLFLGISFDEILTFNSHIKHIRAKTLQRLNIIKVLSNSSWHLDMNTLAD